MIKAVRLSIVGLVLALFGVGAVVLAQTEQVNLSLSPQTFDFDANPGESYTNSFRIVNGSDQAITMAASTKNFTPQGEEGAVALTEETTSWSVASWIDVSPLSASIEPRGSQTFEFTVDIPQTAEPGSHFGAIILKTEPAQLNTTGPSVSEEIGPLILVKVAGAVTEGASVESFGATQGIWTKGPVVLETRVMNSGNVHFKPKGTITIKNIFGNEVTKIDLQEQNILPDSVRRLINEWDPGTFAFGRYTANLSLVYGENDTILTSSTSFFVFPLVSSLLVVGGIAVLTAAIVGRRRLSKALQVLAGK